VHNDSGCICQIKSIREDDYCLWPLDSAVKGYLKITDIDNEYHLWTIQDAKDGDVLQLGEVTTIFKKYIGRGHCRCYCSVCDGEFEIPSQDGADNDYGCDNATPATKEQRNTLIEAMADAEYAFDFEKKELKKIEQKPAKWSEKDESMHTRCIGVLGKCYMGELPTKVEEELNWLKYLDNRVQLQPKQEWNKEDEDTIKFLISHFCVSHYNRSFQFTTNKLITHDELLEKIRNLRPHWKPSDNQMDALDYYANSICTYSDRQDDLRSLFNDLKKLTK